MHCVLEIAGKIHKNVYKEKERGKNWNRAEKLEKFSGLRRVILEQSWGTKTIKRRDLFICASPARLVDENTKCRRGEGEGLATMTSRAFESWVVATSTASVGLSLQTIIASIVLIMWPHPYSRMHVGIPALTCSVNKPLALFPCQEARWRRDRWQKGREPRIWELVRVAAGASVKATGDRTRGRQMRWQ